MGHHQNQYGCAIQEPHNKACQSARDRINSTANRRIDNLDGNLSLRPESISDQSVIHAINEAAFGRPVEAALVDQLRAEAAVLLSLVAELDRRVVGHILFSRMSIQTADASIPAVALAPMAVLPGYQRKGIGGKLIWHGLEILRERGERMVIVLGHPHLYTRFGFSCEQASLLQSPFPAEAFMALRLGGDSQGLIRGRVRYAAAFGLI